MSLKKIYTLGKTKQLIDINGESVNFEATLRITTKNKEPFNFIVLDQNTLDTAPAIEYKNAEGGEATSNIKVENNVFQNYYLVLKSDTPCICEVEINKQELPLVHVPQEPAPVIAQKEPSKPKWKNVILVVGVLCIAVGAYLYLKPNKEKRDVPVGSRSFSPAAKSDSGSSDNNAILQRLKNLNLNAK